MVGEPVAHEAPASGDEGAHDGSPYRAACRGASSPLCRPRGPPRTGRPPRGGRRWRPRCGRRRSRGPGRRRSAVARTPPDRPASSASRASARPAVSPGSTRTATSPATSSMAVPAVVTSGAPQARASRAGQSEPLVEGRVDGRRRRAQQGGHGLVGHVPGPDDPGGQAGPGRRPGPPSSAPQPAPPARTSRASVWRPATRPNASHQAGDVLAGLEGADEEQERATVGRGAGRWPPAGRRRPRSEGSSGRKRSGVDTVGGHEHPGVDPAPAGRAASAVIRLGQTTAAARRAATRMARRKNRTLDRSCQAGSSKKLRSWTVTTVGHLRPLGHGVVRTVVDRHIVLGQQSGQANLLPGQPERAVDRGRRPRSRRPGPRRAATAGASSRRREQHEVHSSRAARAPASPAAYRPAPTGRSGTAVTSSESRSRGSSMAQPGRRMGGLLPHGHVPAGHGRPRQLRRPGQPERLADGTARRRRWPPPAGPRRSTRRRAGRPRGRPRPCSAAPAGHHRGPEGHRLDRGEAEALDEGHVGEQAGHAVEGGQLGRRHQAGQHHAGRGPHPLAPSARARPAPGPRARAGSPGCGRRPGRGGAGSCAARACPRSAGRARARPCARAGGRPRRVSGGGRWSEPMGMTVMASRRAPASARSSATTSAGTMKRSARRSARRSAASCQARPRGG